MNSPGLFGLKNTNRDFKDPETWGKNQFNSSFPAALACFMKQKDLKANYLAISGGVFTHKEISFEGLFGTDPLDDDTYFSFETAFNKFAPQVVGRMPGTDLVTASNDDKSIQYAPLEIKLTALPDMTTANLAESEYGSELVVRPDTILYLCLLLHRDNKDVIFEKFNNNRIEVQNWTDSEKVLEKLTSIYELLLSIVSAEGITESPVLMQPIWKTEGQSPKLKDKCLDIFVWSTLGFLKFILDIGYPVANNKITRATRTIIWIHSTLRDLALANKTDFSSMVDSLSYGTRNDKAFAASGRVTNTYMKCANLETPRIKKSEISQIIIGGGQNNLSPERRFDAIVVNSPEIFDAESN